MKSLLTLGLLVMWAISGSGFPLPREKPLLKCELRLRPDGKYVSIVDGKPYTSYYPDAGDITITNISDADVDIGSSEGPYGHFDLKVKDPAGNEVKNRRLPSRTFTSDDGKHLPFILEPGNTLPRFVGLLVTVPEEKLVIGTYKVRAVFTLGNKAYESDWVEVKWPGEKK